MGLSLAEVKDILAVQGRQQPTCQHVRSLLETTVAEIDDVLRALTALRQDLVRLLEQSEALEDCRPAGGRICSIIEQVTADVQPVVLQRLKLGERHATLP